jgi:hypothetical protein
VTTSLPAISRRDRVAAVTTVVGLVAALGALAATVHPVAYLARLLTAAERLKREPELILSHLELLRSQPDLLDEVRRRSYWHSNGFAKIKIIVEDHFCVRLHIWPPGANRRGDVNPHKHRWEFASWVLLGQGLVESYFTESDSEDVEAVAHIRCDYGPSSQGGFLYPRGVAWLRKRSTHRLSAGTIYPCSREVLHTVAPDGDQLVATVVLQGPVIENTAKVYLHPDGPPEEPQRPISAAELDDLLAEVEAVFLRDRPARALECSV